jgi:uncharacterized membrane protein
MSNTTVEEGKTNAIITYITIIGLIIGFVLNNTKKNSFVSFHIRQMLGLSLFALVNAYIIGRFSGIASMIIGIGLLVLWVIGLLGAVNGEEKKIPLLGDQFQDWFKSIG